jgi:hydrogenase maturation protein HypF
LTKDEYAFISQHIGDLKNYETLSAYQESIKHFESLFRIQPELLVYDLHPDYLSTRYLLDRADEEDLPALPVQHHHAHIAACLADNHYPGDEPVLGLAFDGIGFGEDGNIWGGEVMLADYQSYTRVGYLSYFPLPGGDLAIKEPWRTALSLLKESRIPLNPDLPPVAYAQSLPETLPGLSAMEVFENQLKTGTNSPLTSSIGRLFDGVASLIGVCHKISYEGQAAIEMEALADQDENKQYTFDIREDQTFSPAPLLAQIADDLKQGVDIPLISARFHNSLAELVLELAVRQQRTYNIKQVALSGGVWQNMSLLKKSILKLQAAGFKVFVHSQVPANDGGLALGQAVIGQKFLSQ